MTMEKKPNKKTKYQYAIIFDSGDEPSIIERNNDAEAEKYVEENFGSGDGNISLYCLTAPVAKWEWKKVKIK